MRNIRVYNYFYSHRNSSFTVKFFMISLVRTLVFNLNNDKTLYYRKNCINSRKISLVGEEKKIVLENKFILKNVNYSKYNIKKIDNIMYEYVGSDCLFSDKNVSNFDIVAKNNNRKFITSDSVVRKFYKDEIVTMCFDEDSFNKNKLWINSIKDNNKYNDKYNNLNLNS